jgi:hypothetical protein
MTPQGQTSSATEKLDFTFKQEGSSWLIYGDQKIVRTQHSVQMEMRTDSFPNGPATTYRDINVDLEAPVNTIASATISGGPFSGTAMPKRALTRTYVLKPTPTTQLSYVTNAFVLNPGPQSSLPAPGTVFTFNITPVSGSPVAYTLTSRGVSGEPISFTVTPATHALAQILGQSLTVTWQLTKTYPADQIVVHSSVLDTQTESTVFEQPFGPGATSATMSFPATMPISGHPIVGAYLNLSIDGPNGERGLVVYNFQ